MIKHRGFPEYVPGTELKVTIRRAAKVVTPVKARERFRDRKRALRDADAFFLSLLWERFGDQPFERGNLDAGRLNWLIGREVVWADEPPDPASYDARLRLVPEVIAKTFPEVLG